MDVGLILVFFLLIFTPLSRGTIAPWSCGIVHLTCLGIVVSLFIHNIREKAKIDWKQFRTPLDLPILFFLSLAILSVAFSVNHKKSAFELFKIIDYIIIYYLVVYSCNSRKKITLCIYLILSMGFFLAIFGIIQYMGGASHSWWESLRLSGPFTNHNYFAGYLAMVILLGLGVMFTRLETSKRLFLGYAMIMMTIAYVLTLCRMGWVSMILSLAVIVLLLALKTRTYNYGDNERNPSLRFIIAVVIPVFIVVSLGIILLGFKPLSNRMYSLFDPKNKSERESLNGRIPRWRATLKIIKDYPVTGAGLGTFPFIHTKYIEKIPDFDAYVWNEYLQIGMESGLLSLVIFLWLIGRVLARCVYIYFRAESRFKQGLSLGIFGGVLNTSLHIFTAPLLHFMSNSILLAILVGMAMSRYFVSLESCR